MSTSGAPQAGIDDYIGGFPPRTAQVLTTVRELIRRVVPDATECIAYGMPTFELRGNLVHFAAWKDHLGLYGVLPSGDLLAEVKQYVGSKSTLVFRWDEPLPLELVERVIAQAVARRRAAIASGAIR